MMLWLWRFQRGDIDDDAIDCGSGETSEEIDIRPREESGIKSSSLGLEERRGSDIWLEVSELTLSDLGKREPFICKDEFGVGFFVIASYGLQRLL